VKDGHAVSDQTNENRAGDASVVPAICGQIAGERRSACAGQRSSLRAPDQVVSPGLAAPAAKPPAAAAEQKKNDDDEEQGVHAMILAVREPRAAPVSSWS
jgi:hypothetical protein